MTDKIGIILIGGTGYGAKEFLRLSLNHPKLDVAHVCSTSKAGERINETHRELGKLSDLKFTKELNLETLAPYSKKFLVLALPHGESQNFIGKNYALCRSNGVQILDLSGDFRIKNKEIRESWYPSRVELQDEIFNSFTYGLPELSQEEIKSAINIANPGCFATGAGLSLHPLIKQLGDKIINIAIDGKSGSSGGGKTPKNSFHHPELNGSAYPYAILNHRHEAEIEEFLGLSEKGKVAFVPHVIPLSRGMLISSYVFMGSPVDQREVLKLYQDQYKDNYFVRLVNSPPEIRLVAGSNFADIHIQVRNNIVSITCALDNLIKGMAGQAIQNINIIAGLDETIGLKMAPLGLV